MKQMLTTGAIVLASVMGGRTILGAMCTDEEDTATACDRASSHQEAMADARAISEHAHAD